VPESGTVGYRRTDQRRQQVIHQINVPGLRKNNAEAILLADGRDDEQQTTVKLGSLLRLALSLLAITALIISTCWIMHQIELETVKKNMLHVAWELEDLAIRVDNVATRPVSGKGNNNETRTGPR
jgi:hypothetical protein